MTGDDFRLQVQAQSTLLGPKLYEGMAVSLAGAEQRALGRYHAKYPFLRPQLTRVEMREFLEAEQLPGAWAVGGDSRLMGQLFLEDPDHQMRLQFLKERRRRYPGGVPPAGHNHARRRTWQQPPLFSFGPTQDPTRQDHLLLLWDYTSSPGSDTTFTLRIVHTIESGEFGRAVRCDLDLEVRAGGQIFENLEFDASPEEENFFEVEIDEEENEG
jgi:hypothetical protein